MRSTYSTLSVCVLIALTSAVVVTGIGWMACGPLYPSPDAGGFDTSPPDVTEVDLSGEDLRAANLELARCRQARDQAVERAKALERALEAAERRAADAEHRAEPPPPEPFLEPTGWPTETGLKQLHEAMCVGPTQEDITGTPGVFTFDELGDLVKFRHAVRRAAVAELLDKLTPEERHAFLGEVQHRYDEHIQRSHGGRKPTILYCCGAFIVDLVAILH
jgi:predicted flap endonuclease-1-like 5' DNA nuclease